MGEKQKACIEHAGSHAEQRGPAGAGLDAAITEQRSQGAASQGKARKGSVGDRNVQGRIRNHAMCASRTALRKPQTARLKVP